MNDLLGDISDHIEENVTDKNVKNKGKPYSKSLFVK